MLNLRAAFIWLVSLCFLAMGLSTPVLAQSPVNIPVIEGQNESEIVSSVNDIEKSLQTLEQVVQNLQKSDESLLTQLPVTADNIDARIDALDSDPQQPVTQTQINTVESIIQRIDKAQNTTTKQQSTLLENKEKLQKTISDIKSLQQLLSNPLNQSALSADKREQVPALLTQAEILLQQYNQQQLHLNDQQQQLNSAIGLLNRWQAALSGTLLAQQNTHQDKTEKNRLDSQQKDHLKQATELQNQLNDGRTSLDLATIENLQQSIYRQQNLAWLTGIDLALFELITDNHYFSHTEQSLATNNLEQLTTQLTATEKALQQLSELKKRLEARYDAFEKRTAIAGEDPELSEAFSLRKKRITYQQLQLQNYPEQLAALISNQKQMGLFTQDALYRSKQFDETFKALPESLLLMAYQVKISFQTLYKQVIANPIRIVFLAIIWMLLIIGLLRLIAHYVTYVHHEKKQSIGIIHSLRKIFHVFQKHIWSITFLLFLLALVRVSEVPAPSSNIIRLLIYTSLALLVWWELANIEKKLGTIPKSAANKSNAASTLLALSTLAYNIADLSAANALVVSLYEKLLFITLIIFTVVIKQNLAHYLTQEQAKISNKLYKIYLWLLSTIPWLVIAMCAIGLFGFGSLTWLILGYLAMGTIYLMALTIGLTTINQLRKSLKLYSIKRFSHGAFIAQDIVSPLSSIGKIVWIWAMTALLFAVLNWDRSTYLIAKTLDILNYPIVNFSNSPISLHTILLLVLSIYLIFRIAKWLRTFSYHWLYARINDLGVRNSLSIFSQYVAILLGVFIALNAIGIDLTSLTVFAGALGVGVGLGLQDIAKNFISGILILIERPLRSGDWVTIDGTDGTVKSIGMRAITMETFDNQEVIIPNAGVISNSFTNWTHSNSVTRTVLYIGASYSAAPEKVLAILNDILAQTAAVLKDPESQVVLWEYADSSINYRVQYYINLDQHGLLSTRTEVLKTIWHQFAEHDIEIPFPQQDIHFKSVLAAEAASIKPQSTKTES